MPSVSHRSALALLMAVLPLTFSCHAAIQWKVQRLAQGNPEVLYYVNTQTRAVALTIDDGPDPVTTSRLLDVLRQNHAHATFFIITGRVPGNEKLLQRMVDENHELGNHLTRNEASIRLSPEKFERELLESHKVLSKYAAMRWFRPGTGRYNARMLAALHEHGYRCALGSVYPFDPQIPSSWFSTWFILHNTQPGSIIILHDWGGKGKRTVKTLSKVLPELRRRGYSIVTLTELERMGEASGVGPPSNSNRK
ncbi:MAG: hypothetical protein A2Y95_11030 [Deltaproteobacteria bacterium RBG_13_65_10]|nr:MAG: hypothetical protein A2Y95_11030 [Deltaproteobacteria bacterium RBG_13_65_10]